MSFYIRPPFCAATQTLPPEFCHCLIKTPRTRVGPGGARGHGPLKRRNVACQSIAYLPPSDRTPDENARSLHPCSCRRLCCIYSCEPRALTHSARSSARCAMDSELFRCTGSWDDVQGTLSRGLPLSLARLLLALSASSMMRPPSQAESSPRLHVNYFPSFVLET